MTPVHDPSHDRRPRCAPRPAPPSAGSSGRTSPTAELYEDAVRAGEGLIAAEGPLVVRTGKHTGRSPQDKFIVKEPRLRREDLVGRGQPPDRPRALRPAPGPADGLPRDRPVYAQDCFIGAHPAHRRSLRVYTETAWASIFARNLFRRPGRRPTSRRSARTSRSSTSRRSRPTRRPRAPGPGPRSSSTSRRMEILIVGTEYAGEIKKSAFTVMNYLMPDEGVLPMHSAANVGEDGDIGRLLRPLRDRQDDALGRSRSGASIGDDEHGWGVDGVFNFEGGCYAKTIRLSPDVRARHLPDDPPLRDDPRERRPRPGDPRARPRLGPLHREHPRRLPAPVHRQRRPDRDGRPADERRPPDGRRVRRPAADQPADRATRPSTTSSAATPRSWPAPRSGSRSRRRRSRPASAPRSCRATRASTRRCWPSASPSTASGPGS